MTKKIIALCALLSINSFVCANGYPAGQGYEAPKEHSHHHGHHHDKIADEADQRRLHVLEEEDQNAYQYTNITRCGVLVGGIMTAMGMLSREKSFTLAGAGTVIFVLSGVSGYIIGERDDARAQARAKERKEILERRSKHPHR